MRECGYTYSDLVQELGISQDSVWRILKDNNLLGLGDNRTDDHTKNRILHLRSQNVPYRKIAERLGVNKVTVWKHLKKTGLIKDSQPVPTKKRRISPTMTDVLKIARLTPECIDPRKFHSAQRPAIAALVRRGLLVQISNGRSPLYKLCE